MELRRGLVLTAAWDHTRVLFPNGIQRSHIYQIIAQLRKSRVDPTPDKDVEFGNLDIRTITPPNAISPMYALRDEGGSLGVNVKLQFVFVLLEKPKRVLVLRLYHHHADFKPSVVSALMHSFEELLKSDRIPAIEITELVQVELQAE